MASLHASAVAIAGRALLIRGPSRSGKSRLAFALIARSSRLSRIVLVGDDRIVLRESADGLVATSHPRIAGFIERRGLGLVAMPWSPEAPVAGVVRIGAVPPDPWLDGFPSLDLVASCDVEAGVAHVLAWWTSGVATPATHPPGKADGRLRSCAKDYNW